MFISFIPEDWPFPVIISETRSESGAVLEIIAVFISVVDTSSVLCVPGYKFAWVETIVVSACVTRICENAVFCEEESVVCPSVPVVLASVDNGVSVTNKLLVKKDSVENESVVN